MVYSCSLFSRHDSIRDLIGQGAENRKLRHIKSVPWGCPFNYLLSILWGFFMISTCEGIGRVLVWQNMPSSVGRSGPVVHSRRSKLPRLRLRDWWFLSNALVVTAPFIRRGTHEVTVWVAGPSSSPFPSLPSSSFSSPFFEQKFQEFRLRPQRSPWSHQTNSIMPAQTLQYLI